HRTCRSSSAPRMEKPGPAPGPGRVDYPFLPNIGRFKPMGVVARGPGDVRSPRRRPTTEAMDAGALRVDVDIRLKGTGRKVTRAQIAAATGARATLGWPAMHFH